MSRSNARSQGLRRRASRTIPASIVAVVLATVGALASITAVTRLVNGTWPAPVTAAATALVALTWGSAATIIGGVVLSVVGLILMIAGLTRGSLKTARLTPGTATSAAKQTDFVITTRAMARLAASRADRVDGVDKVSASASGRRVHVKVATTSEQADQIRDHVRRDVSETLSSAGIHPVPRVTATVRTKRI